MIEVKGLVKTYAGKKVVDEVSFYIKKGEIFGILGPNGAGKTTIIKILTTLVKPDKGEALINGFDLFKEPQEIKKIIGVVPQENNLDRDLTIYENLVIYGMLHRVSGLKSKIEEVLRLVELWDRRDSLVSTLSGGMQRRLVLARAILTDPLILILDEPTVGLDPQIRRFLWEIIRRKKMCGRTILLTSHYIEEAENLCDRVGIIHQGKLIALGSPSELKDGLGRFVVEHINGDGKLIQWICKSKEEAYSLIHEKKIPLSIRAINLEDVFINLTGKRLDQI